METQRVPVTSFTKNASKTSSTVMRQLSTARLNPFRSKERSERQRKEIGVELGGFDSDESFSDEDSKECVLLTCCRGFKQRMFKKKKYAMD